MSSPVKPSKNESDVIEESLAGIDEAKFAAEEAEAIGVTPSGQRFEVPDTLSVLEALISPTSWKSPGTQLWIALGAATIFSLYFYYAGILPRWFFVVQFLFWRVAYNGGLGYLLHTQSNGRRFETVFRDMVKSNSALRKLLETSVVFKDATVYKVDNFPDEFNAWMLFRFVVMIILANDLVGYFICVIVYWEAPNFFSLVDILAYVVGMFLIAFALWSKADAHRVIGDYAWYWGDFFFLLDKSLVFDGIFQMFPHPMYSVGYAFMYGFSLMAKSHTVFYVSLAGHLMQLAFLVFVENPHIDKTYNAMSEPSVEERRREELLYGTDDSEGYMNRKELIVLKNLNIFRASDVLLLCMLSYAALIAVLDVPLYVHVLHYCVWRVVLNGGLGYLLRCQSERNAWVERYPSAQAAFDNWKMLYNAVVTMTNVTYLVLVLRATCWSTPLIEGTSTRLLSITMGLLLVLIHGYVVTSVHDAIGDFGYFYGDFFVDDVPAKLTYSGIFRYLNNPDSTLGFCGYYGLALISASPVVFFVALASHAASKSFEVLVERPHMARRYQAVRSVGGLRSEMKRKTEQWAKVVQSKRAEYERVLKQMQGHMERTKSDLDAIKTRVGGNNTAAAESKKRK